MSNIFVLDDDMDTRLPIIKTFLQKRGVNLDDIEFQCAKSAYEAFRIFRVVKYFDIGFFDHDIGNDFNGVDVAKMSDDMNVLFENVYVHSANPIGSVNIQRYFNTNGSSTFAIVMSIVDMAHADDTSMQDDFMPQVDG